MGSTALAVAITLVEPIRGHCPVCLENWSADPDCHCACTRPRPGDAEEIAKAYLHAAACRTARLSAQAVEDARTSNVLPIRPLSRARASAR
jgi:hypothetical protein